MIEAMIEIMYMRDINYLSYQAQPCWDEILHVIYTILLSLATGVMKLTDQEAPMTHLGYSPVPGFFVFKTLFPFSFSTTRHS